MKISIAGHLTEIGTGGRPFDADLPTVVFLAGAGGDHHTWNHQSEWFANNGFGVLLPNYPAHSGSAGAPLTSVEQGAKWLQRVLAAVGVKHAHWVGHSLGFLLALEIARQQPDIVRSLTGVATAAAIPVNPDLIATAKSAPDEAAKLMVKWGFGPLAHLAADDAPMGKTIASARHSIAASPLADDLNCCAAYNGGESAIEVVKKAKIPCSMILAGEDKMTPIQAGRATAESLGAELTVIEEHGHMLPLEAPGEVLEALRVFLARHQV